MTRIFHVRLNLDAVSADLNTLVDDKERGEWLRGFMSGASGGVNRFIDTSPSHLGWHHGNSARGHAEQFQEKQAAYGAKSAEARKAKYGTAQPERPSEGGSNDPRTTIEPDSNLSNNPIIEEENKPINQKTKKPITPVLACVNRHKFRLKGSCPNVKSALLEVIKKVGIDEADSQLSEISNVWASEILDMIHKPRPEINFEEENEAMHAAWTKKADIDIARMKAERAQKA